MVAVGNKPTETFACPAMIFCLVPPYDFSTYSRKVHNYATIGDADLDFFRGVVGPSSVKTSAEDLEAFNVDWMKKYQGKSPAAVLPRTTEEVSLVLRHCHERNIPVVPQGGNTGLVGGSVPVGGELVLSTSRMNSITSFDPLASVLVCEVRPAQQQQHG